ncbi:unnamed protein product [Fraxinus pennsylvanica]|uniref:Uncharacterized protein n=1 Tax=Fraxinus pennsylvanica TaxID=56036 RepID=A0AAD1YTS3_9LAMI|nr:unnamed protein product [Fraxinus pennsylvanica]
MEGKRMFFGSKIPASLMSVLMPEGPKPLLPPPKNSGLHVFSFLANFVLREVLSAIQKGKPGALSPGRPPEFLKNYKASPNFLAYLEGLCPSRFAISKSREEAVYMEFMKQWNTGVYFTFRILNCIFITDSQTGCQLDWMLAKPVTQEDTLKYQNGVCETIIIETRKNVRHKTEHESANEGKGDLLTPWRERAGSEKMLAGNHIWWKRRIWLMQRLIIHLELMQVEEKLDFRRVRKKSYSEGVGSGGEGEGEGEGEGNKKCQFSLNLLEINHDLNCLVEEICSGYLGNVLEPLISCSPEVPDLVRQSILQGGNSLEVLPPLAFLDGKRVATYLTGDFRNELLQGATSEITLRYYVFDADCVSVLFLDIQEYARNLASLGVDAANIPYTVPYGNVLHLETGKIQEASSLELLLFGIGLYAYFFLV